MTTAPKKNGIDALREHLDAQQFPPVDAYDVELVAPQRETPAGCTTKSVTHEDFHAYLPDHKYLFGPTREMWPAASVNARVTSIEKPAEWLDKNRAVEQMTWAPGHPLLIRDRLVADGGWIERPGCSVFNLYRAPQCVSGDARKAAPWLDLVVRLFGDDGADHIVRWLAHRAQFPGQKINHALVIGGAPGIGKDTLLEPVKHAVGPWNFAEVSPSQAMGRFNGFVKSTIARLSEARDLGDVDRYAFYEHLKTLTAAPPDVLRVDEKNLREHYVFNVVGIVITTNHKTDGIHLPADDRRHYVAWSDAVRDDFEQGYWNRIYGWYASGGIAHVAAYLREMDLAGFDAKAPPPKTAAFWAVVDANRAPEDAELADVVEALGNRDAVTLAQLSTYATDEFREWLNDRRNRRQVPHRLESVGYVPVRNDTASDGLWKIDGRRQAVYALAALSQRDRLVAAQQISRGTR